MGPDEKVNVLLVDDQPAKLLTYEAVLADLGENLIKANSAQEALAFLLRTDVAVILIDVCMPDLDGFELVSMIREHPRFDGTSIILISAVLMSDMDRLHGYERGAVDYVSVPIVPEILRAKVAVFADLYRKSRQLERMNEDLERRVEERTNELRAADRRKDEFLAVLSHELRNPLASIRNAVEILRLQQFDDPAAGWCRDVIDRQIDQLTRLVDDLLDVSRITEGKIKLRTSPVNLSTVVQEAVETCLPYVRLRKHELSVSLTDAPSWIDGDPVRLTQVVTNLLNNAAKYQEEGGQIALSLEREGEHAILRVRDHGVGIDPQMLSRVFDLFAQEEQTVYHAEGGLGIGLSLVKALVEMHGGTAQAYSEGRGRGAELMVRLPCTGRAPEHRGTAHGHSVLAAAPTGLSVLEVDDNRDVADSVAILLRRAGHEVTVANDGIRALELARAHPPDVVLLDIGLPGMDGIEVCRRLREQGLQGARIVGMTGYGRDVDRKRLLDAGFDAHLVKPVEPEELLKLLADAAARRLAAEAFRKQGRAAAPTAPAPVAAPEPDASSSEDACA